MLEINSLIDEILTPLPHRPYCSDDLADGFVGTLAKMSNKNARDTKIHR